MSEIEWFPLTHPPLGTWPTTQIRAQNWNWNCDLSAHKPVLSPLSHMARTMIPIFKMKKLELRGVTSLLRVTQLGSD